MEVFQIRESIPKITVFQYNWYNLLLILAYRLIFNYSINHYFATMALKHTIDQEVYTNSLIFYPNFDEDKITDYYWRRRNSSFSSSYEQKIMQYPPELSYQCSVLDYRSTIELITIV